MILKNTMNGMTMNKYPKNEAMKKLLKIISAFAFSWVVFLICFQASRQSVDIKLNEPGFKAKLMFNPIFTHIGFMKKQIAED